MENAAAYVDFIEIKGVRVIFWVCLPVHSEIDPLAALFNRREDCIK